MSTVIGCWFPFFLEISYRQDVCPTIARMGLPY
jgi:hypothetical protein